MEHKWDVNIDDEWNQMLLKSIIKGTGYPPNYVDAYNDVDFARTVIMQNAMLVKRIISDQNQFSKTMTEVVRRLFRNEYEKDYVNKENQLENILRYLEVVFTKPVALNINNINEQINNASQEIDFIVNMYFPEEQSTGMEEDEEEMKKKENLKNRFRNKVSRDILPSIDWDHYDELLSQSNLELNAEKLKNDANMTIKDIEKQNSNGMNDMGGEEGLDDEY